MDSTSEKTITTDLLGVQKLEFTSLHRKEIEQCIEWIVESSADLVNSSNDTPLLMARGLYLCVLLGNLFLTSSSDINLQLPKSLTTTLACDNLLSCLVRLFRQRWFISPRSNKCLEAIASQLNANSSNPGWLGFAGYFIPLFGIMNIVDMDIPSSKYENNDYISLINLVLSHDMVNYKNADEQDKPHYTPFLKKILKLAPDEKSLLQVFANKEIKRCFYRQQDMEKFCSDFYKENFLTSSEDNVNISEKLKVLTDVPKNIRVKLLGVLYSYLLKFIETVDKPTNEDLENFIDIQLSLKLSKDQIYSILTQLSTSEIAMYQDLLLKLLNNEGFYIQWNDVQNTPKHNICITWVKTRACANELSKIRVRKAYYAAENLVSCELVSKALREKLLESLRELLFSNVQPEDIFTELKDLQEFQQFDVRESCVKLIDDVLNRNLEIVNNRRLLTELSHSR